MTKVRRGLFYITYFVTHQGFISEKGIDRPFKSIGSTAGHCIDVRTCKTTLPHIVRRKTYPNCFNGIQADGLGTGLPARERCQAKCIVKDTTIDGEVVVKIMRPPKLNPPVF